MNEYQLVGMTRSARKRRARAVAFYYVWFHTFLDVALREARPIHAYRFRQYRLPRHDYDRVSYGQVRALFQIDPLVRDFIRTSGDCICSTCQQPYRKHRPDFSYLVPDGTGQLYPWLHVLCDGTRVKL